jgi:hypothetical protein
MSRKKKPHAQVIGECALGTTDLLRVVPDGVQVIVARRARFSFEAVIEGGRHACDKGIPFVALVEDEWWKLLNAVGHTKETHGHIETVTCDARIVKETLCH